MSECASFSTFRWISEYDLTSSVPHYVLEVIEDTTNIRPPQSDQTEHHGKLRLEFTHHVTSVKSRESEVDT